MNWKRLGKALLFPPTAIALLLVPVATSFLIYSMVFLGTESVAAILSYVLAAYTLTVWCFRAPRLIKDLKALKKENKYIRRWQNDERLRRGVSLYGSFAFNTAYAVFQLWLGFYHHTFWFYSLAGYYVSLAVMRFFLMRHTRRFKAGEHLHNELIKYRACGWILLVMNLALALMIFFMVYWNRTFHHHEITAIAMAAYTFGAFAIAITHLIGGHGKSSPVYAASDAIRLAAACVSIITLESTMLTTFGADTVDTLTRKLLLGISGGAVAVFITLMAIYMIVQGTKQIRQLKEKEIPNGKQ